MDSSLDYDSVNGVYRPYRGFRRQSGEASSSANEEEKMATMKREQKRRPKPKDKSTLICGVCGDKALGYNFDAITCESCKAFFRRNAHKTKSFACSFDGNCSLDTHTRKFCAGCRLRKCFTIGMKKDWILTEAQLQKRRKRNSFKQTDTFNPDNYCEEDMLNSAGESAYGCGDEGGGSVSNSPVTEPWKSPKPENVIPIGPVPELIHSPFPSETSSVHTPLSDAECIPVIKTEKIDFEEEDVITPLPAKICQEINALKTTYHAVFDAPYSENQEKKLKSDVRSADDLFNMTDLFIKRLIKFAKSIPEFRSLVQEDQISLLKGGVLEIMYLRSASSFDERRRSWLYKGAAGSGSLKADVLHTLGDKGFSSHISFVMSLHQLCANDPVIIILLFVIELFSPDRGSLANKELVSTVQEKFSLWMKLYVESKYPLSEARVLYPKLLMKLTDVRTLGEHSSEMASKLDISRMEPLLVEMFSLK